MKHKLKRLGSGLGVVLALSLVITSISAAAQFTASSYPAVYEREGNPSAYGVVTTEAGSMECNSGTVSGTLSEATSTLSISGKVGGCKGFGFLSGTVNENGCTSLAHVKEGSVDTYTGTADLVCPAGKSVITTISTCEVQVPPQTGTVTLGFTNKTGAEGTVSINFQSSGVKYIVTKDGVGCPFNGTGERTNGSLSQSQTVIVHINGRNLQID